MGPVGFEHDTKGWSPARAISAIRQTPRSKPEWESALPRPIRADIVPSVSPAGVIIEVFFIDNFL
jgi:hypothetical protein